MKIKIEYNSDTGEGYEFFNDVDAAIEYLQYLKDNIIIEEDIETEEDNRNYVLEMDKISISKNSPNIEEDLIFYIEKGFLVTYEGKTGYTLEKKDI
jgi:hypothetical protein